VREKEKSKMISEWEETALPEMGKIPGELPMRTTQGTTCHVADLCKPWECLHPPKSSSSAHLIPAFMGKANVYVRVTDTHTLTLSRWIYVNIYNV